MNNLKTVHNYVKDYYKISVCLLDLILLHKTRLLGLMSRVRPAWMINKLSNVNKGAYSGVAIYIYIYIYINNCSWFWVYKFLPCCDSSFTKFIEHRSCTCCKAEYWCLRRDRITDMDHFWFTKVGCQYVWFQVCVCVCVCVCVWRGTIAYTSTQKANMRSIPLYYW